MNSKSWGISTVIAAGLSGAAALLTLTGVPDPVFAVLAGLSVAAAATAVALVTERRTRPPETDASGDRVKSLLEEAHRLSVEQARLQSALSEAIDELSARYETEPAAEKPTRDRGASAETY